LWTPPEFCFVLIAFLLPSQNLEAQNLSDFIQGRKGKLAGFPYDLIWTHG